MLSILRRSGMPGVVYDACVPDKSIAVAAANVISRDTY